MVLDKHEKVFQVKDVFTEILIDGGKILDRLDHLYMVSDKVAYPIGGDTQFRDEVKEVYTMYIGILTRLSNYDIEVPSNSLESLEVFFSSGPHKGVIDTRVKITYIDVLFKLETLIRKPLFEFMQDLEQTIVEIHNIKIQLENIENILATKEKSLINLGNTLINAIDVTSPELARDLMLTLDMNTEQASVFFGTKVGFKKLLIDEDDELTISGVIDTVKDLVRGLEFFDIVYLEPLKSYQEYFSITESKSKLHLYLEDYSSTDEYTEIYDNLIVGYETLKDFTIDTIGTFDIIRTVTSSLYVHELLQTKFTEGVSNTGGVFSALDLPKLEEFIYCVKDKPNLVDFTVTEFALRANLIDTDGFIGSDGVLEVNQQMKRYREWYAETHTGKFHPSVEEHIVLLAISIVQYLRTAVSYTLHKRDQGYISGALGFVLLNIGLKEIYYDNYPNFDYRESATFKKALLWSAHTKITEQQV